MIEAFVGLLALAFWKAILASLTIALVVGMIFIGGMFLAWAYTGFKKVVKAFRKEKK